MRDEKNPNRIYGFGDKEVALLEYLNTWILGNGTPPKRKISTSRGNMG